MLDGVIEEIEKWMHGLLTGMVTANMSTMYEDVNTQIGTIAGEVGKTPQGWNGSIYSLIHSLSDTVMMPIAGVIITYVLCYELISMLTEKNSMHDIDTWMFFKYLIKAWIAVYLVSHTLDITLAVFDLGRRAVSAASGTISGSAAIDVSSLISDMETKMEDMELGELAALVIETFIISFGMKLLSVLITVILYVRMVEIYLYISVAPVPFATFSNREWGQIGNNYLRGLFALAFQGFFIMVCVGIYAVLVGAIHMADDIHSALFGVAAYTVILCMSLMRTGSLSRSIFNAH